MRINTLLGMLTVALSVQVAAYSQERIIDMEVLVARPLIGEVVQSGDQVPFIVYLKNNGPGTLLEGDSLFCRLPNGGVQMLLLPQVLETGDSFQIMNTELTATSAVSTIIDVCFQVISDPDSEVTLRGEPVNVSYVDTLSDNNLMCQNIIIENEEAPSGIANDGKKNLRIAVYPNPATSVLRIIAEPYPKSAFNIRVRDMLGRTVIQMPVVPYGISTGQMHLDISALKPGAYLLELTELDGPKRVVKFMVAGSD